MPLPGSNTQHTLINLFLCRKHFRNGFIQVLPRDLQRGAPESVPDKDSR